MRPQKALDAAIDHVTARMVQVSEDANLTQRIVAALPERASWFRWLIPQFAALAALAIAAVVWTTRDAATPSLLPSADVAGLAGMPGTVAAAPATAVRTMPLESASARNISGELRRNRHLEPLEPVEPLAGDHERSLPAIDAMTVLAVRDVLPDELPARPALRLEPIEITDLPLTTESFPPR